MSVPDVGERRVPWVWRYREGRLAWSGRPWVMGILNVTPDSFSDGGRYLEPATAVDRAMEMVAEGADVIDVGGESTRPGACAVAVDEEVRRVLPVVKAVAARVPVPVSVDTRHAGVARRVLDAGAHIINDVSAVVPDSGMWEVVARAGAGYVAMHMQGEPGTMQKNPQYVDVTAEVAGALSRVLTSLEMAGIAKDCVVVDPGIGFGKTLDHTLALVRGIPLLAGLGRPVLLGLSRKSFLGAVTGAGVSERLAAGLACTVFAAWAGAAMFRTHDVGPTVQALRMIARLADLGGMGAGGAAR